jgi:hypothetical protein
LVFEPTLLGECCSGNICYYHLPLPFSWHDLINDAHMVTAVPGVVLAGSGQGFTPHILTVNTGEVLFSFLDTVNPIAVLHLNTCRCYLFGLHCS